MYLRDSFVRKLNVYCVIKPLLFSSQYGFIAYETDEAKNLFFHTSEMEDDTLSIKVSVH